MVCLTCPLAAQQYAFQYFGVEQGLTNLAVKTLFQDRTGFIWLGTEHGVFRYEGIRFREFTNNDGLKPGVTGSIGEAPDGSVLVGNYLGLSRLRGERFESVPLPGGGHIIGYDNIVAGGHKTWIATDAGLLSATIGPEGNLVLRPGPAPPDPSLKEAQSIFFREGTLWWGCGKSLCRAEGAAVAERGAAVAEKGGKVTVMDQSSGLMPDVITAIVQDPAGNLWVEQNRRLLVLRPGTSRFSPPDTPLPLAGFGSLQVDSDGHVLVPTTEGLAIGQGGTTFRMAKRDAGLLPPVYSVLQDREGSVWLGLAGRGLAKWLGYGEWESFSAQSGLAGETVYEILPQSDGQVWAGTEAGLFRGDRKDGHYTWTLVRSVGAVPVHTVEAAGDGHFWIGTDYGGVARFDPRTEKTEWFTAKDGLTGNLPWALLIDRSQAVWVGNVNGVFRKAAGSSKFEHIPDVTARCFALEQAPDGDIWAGTMNGLWRLDAAGHWKVFTRSDGLIDNAVIAIAPDPSGDIWAGYRLNGVVSRLHFSGEKTTLTHFRPPAGSAMNITYFLAFDAHGKLWAGTNLGVRVFDGRDHWDPFDHRDGLIWDDCDLHGFAAEPDGHVWIGTSGGLSRFMPKEKPAALTPPRTVFTSLMNGKMQLDPAHSYSVEYSSDPLIARFTALRFGHDRDLTFRYKLDPLYKTWRETSDRELQFPALPPGNYRLDVEARDALSGWSDQPASFEFKINAPWWRQWWFLGGCALSGSLLAGLLLRQKNAREESIRRELENAVAERTQELSHQYRHDVLTGLPNRLLFGERLHRELLSARRDDARVAVLFIDLDRFKRINDTWGHQTGDLFLRQISERLRAGLRSGETIARIGGDEFTVLIPGLRDKQEAEKRGWDLLRTLEAPIRIEGKNVFATMSVGISTFPDDALEPGALMAAADAAMYAAKGSGKNQVQVFEAGMTEAASRPQNIEDRLREALKNGGFRLRYQAQYTIDGRLSGFEALLRIHGQERDLGPGEFIPIAEESGLIVEMGAWVLHEACWQMRKWNDAGFRDIRIAVNVSVMQLAHPGFENTLMEVIEETGIDPRNLELELTETALVKDTGDSAGLLNRIRKRGIQVALDDFGTGFSPMQYLHQLPVDVVKIDQVFVKDLDGKPSSIPLVEGMVKLAKTLSLRVVAEGVETPGQFEILRDIGFDVAQGNLLSFPLVAEEAEVLLRSGVLAVAVTH